MGLYSHKKEYSLRYADFDFRDKLKASSLLSVVQESACFSADELRFGYEDLKPRGLAFIVVGTYCKFHREISLTDAIEVETYPLTPRHVIFERDYRVFEKGEVAASLASRWCLVDLNGFSLCRPELLGETHARCPYRDDKAVEVPSWKIPKISEGKKIYELTVTPSTCDHYMHANNARYADFFFDCFSFEELSRPVESFQILYHKQATVGNTLGLFRQDEGDVSICEVRREGETLAQFKLVFGGKA